MGVNVKIGNDTIQGVNLISVENADTVGKYLYFGLSDITDQKVNTSVPIIVSIVE